MNQRILAAADAIAKAFFEMKKEAVLFPLYGDEKFPLAVPDRKYDEAGWKEFTDALKYRHKLEAFRTANPKKAELLVCAYGYMSDAPMITDAEVDEVIRREEVAQEVADEQFAALMQRMK